MAHASSWKKLIWPGAVTNDAIRRLTLHCRSLRNRTTLRRYGEGSRRRVQIGNARDPHSNHADFYPALGRLALDPAGDLHCQLTFALAVRTLRRTAGFPMT